MDKLMSVLDEFLTRINVDCSVEYGEEFCIHIQDKNIEIERDTEGYYFFVKNFINNSGYCHLTPFLMAFLHEVGHYMTDDLISVAEDSMIEDAKKLICLGLEGTDDYDEIEKYNNMYFDQRDEKLATNWAIQFVRDNSKMVSRVNYRIKKILEA